MELKDFKFNFKALDEAGTFEGLASVMGHKDLQGDIIEEGAFAKTLREKKGRVPLLWQHQAETPIGVIDLEEDGNKLKAVGYLNLEVEKAREARALMMQGALGGLSIGFDIPHGKSEVRDGVRYIKEVRMWETSAVTFPANPKARIQRVKDMEYRDELKTVLKRLEKLEDALEAIKTNTPDPEQLQSSAVVEKAESRDMEGLDPFERVIELLKQRGN